jgi:hypothetical protein
LDVAASSPPKGQNHEPVLLELVLAVTLSLVLSEPQAASRQAQAVKTMILMNDP